ncbi:MAG: glycoside hydrolase family 3 C-terminal domain-containing protein [Bacteroidales bacterium]|nr:glycoside hydrolase family 3 C-terminal domain-containing protein [Bacteroidales bacterium]
MKRLRYLPVLLAVLLAAACSERSDYRNPALSPEKRAADLLSKMTTEEKVGQLLCPYGWPMFEKTSGTEATYSEAYVDFVRNQHGGMLWGFFRADPWTRKTFENGLDTPAAISAINALQRYAVDSTRLGIPILLAEEAPHGHMALGTTVFPTGIAMAATWDPDLMEQVGRSVAEELRAVGAYIAYGPVIDLAREPRWSRVEETYGEDPCLTSAMASGLVRGMSPLHNGWDKGVVSTLKHFVAYGVPAGGHNGSPSVIGPRDLYENVLPTFKAGIDAGALSVMTSYNSIDGVPSTANGTLLDGVLRGEWGFDGFIVSDLFSIDGLFQTHHVAAGPEEAAKQALEAGVDVDLGAKCYARLVEEVEAGRVSRKVLDAAVRRVLELKFRLGLFENPYADPQDASVVRSEAHTETALQAAREGIVLLENNGILPLSKADHVAVIGPNADEIYNQLGDYTAPQKDEYITTPLEGIVAKIGAGKVHYAKGCSIRDTKHQNFSEAVLAAKISNVAVVFVGGSSARDFKTLFKETGAATVDSQTLSDMECGEGYDRASLELMGLQLDLLKAIKATGTPMVVVYIEGRPLDKRWAQANADAVLTQFYPGQAGGEAIADVLYGDYNPAGRLPVSVPRTAGQLPVWYNQPLPVPSDYVDLPSTPLYAFGYGLSYTTFSYDRLDCEPLGGNRVRVTVGVTNTGKRDGDEVVQVYVSDPVASTVRPRKQLRAFRRAFLKAGESRTLEFELGPEAFSLRNREMKEVVEPGEFIIQAGPSSDRTPLQETVSL